MNPLADGSVHKLSNREETESTSIDQFVGPECSALCDKCQPPQEQKVSAPET